MIQALALLLGLLSFNWAKTGSFNLVANTVEYSWFCGPCTVLSPDISVLDDLQTYVRIAIFKWLIVKLLFRYILSKDCALNNIQHISYLTKVYPIRADTFLPRRSNYDSTPNFFWMISSKSGCILSCFKLLRVDSILLTSLSLILMTWSCFAFAVSYMHTCFLIWSILAPCTSSACLFTLSCHFSYLSFLSYLNYFIGRLGLSPYQLVSGYII